MTDWIEFSRRLPADSDANSNGCIEVLSRNGERRIAMARWTVGADSWHANGFLKWRRTDDPRDAGTVVGWER